MHRFFVPPESLRQKEVALTGDTARQITRVLRMKPGDEVMLLDGKGYEYRVRLAEFGKEDVRGEALEKRPGSGEPARAVDLYMALLNKPDKFEWALQKCTELGAYRFVPVLAERSVAGAPEANRRERWERIIREAAEQSGRSRLPVLEDALPFKQAVHKESDRLDNAERGRHTAIMPALGADLSLEDALGEALENQEGSVSIFIGPEGGFSDDELWEANEVGIQMVTLGPRPARRNGSGSGVDCGHERVGGDEGAGIKICREWSDSRCHAQGPSSNLSFRAKRGITIPSTCLTNG